MNESHPNKMQATLSFISLMSLFVFVLFTDPRTLSVGLLLVFPVLVFFSAYSVVRLLAQLFSELPKHKVHALSATLAIAPTLMVVLGSLGQLGAQDILLAVLLCVGFAWYLRRLQPLASYASP